LNRGGPIVDLESVLTRTSATAPRDFEIAMLEGRGHAINFPTGYSAAFRLSSPHRLR